MPKIDHDAIQEQAALMFARDAVNTFQTAAEIMADQKGKPDQEEMVMVLAKAFYVAGVERAMLAMDEIETNAPRIQLCSNVQ